MEKQSRPISCTERAEAERALTIVMGRGSSPIATQIRRKYDATGEARRGRLTPVGNSSIVRTMSDEPAPRPEGYDNILNGITEVISAGRSAAARTVNAVMTATYWEVGRRLIEYEQGGEERAQYGKALARSLSADLTRQFGRGFSHRNLDYMRQFYLTWPHAGSASPAAGPSVSSSARSARSSSSARPSRLALVEGAGIVVLDPQQLYGRATLRQ